MTTEKKYPVKECDYCDHVGMAYTTMAGETLCKSCLSDLPTDAAECRKLIVEQRKRIAELESDKEALDRENSSLANLVKNSVKRTAIAESDRNGYAMLIAVLANADNFNEFIKNITVDKASELINKFAIEQQIEALEHEASLWPDDLIERSHVKSLILGSAEKLRQQLNGGE